MTTEGGLPRFAGLIGCIDTGTFELHGNKIDRGSVKEVKIMSDLSSFSLFLRPSLPVNPGYTRVTDSNNQADAEVFLY